MNRVVHIIGNGDCAVFYKPSPGIKLTCNMPAFDIADVYGTVMVDFKMMKARVGKSIESPGSKANKLKLAKQDKRKEKLKELRAKGVGPYEEAKAMNQLSMGGEPRGYGAARTSGMGLQDETLPLDKSLDYYKDIM